MEERGGRGGEEGEECQVHVCLSISPTEISSKAGPGQDGTTGHLVMGQVPKIEWRACAK